MCKIVLVWQLTFFDALRAFIYKAFRAYNFSRGMGRVKLGGLANSRKLANSQNQLAD